jgi:signal transduction histidine kinase
MKPATLLIVEDEKIIAKGIEKQVKGLGYTVAGMASNGADAIQQATGLHPDLVLMDIQLGPGIDGVEAADVIRTGLNLPVVFLTAHSDRVTIQRAKITEPFGYVLKPVEDQDLQTAIEIGLYKYQMERRLELKCLELEKSMQAKDRFLASMAHELRTPLNAIIGFTGMLLMKLPGPLTDDQGGQLRTIDKSAKHLLALINDLLDLAKAESGKLELSPEPVALAEVVGEVIKMMRPIAESKSLTLEVANNQPHVVLTLDRRILVQILLNLVSNAIKFTEAGSVRVEVSQHAEKGVRLATIRVVDTGIGVSPDDQARLFQPFSQVANSDKRQEGTGLGLHLSRNLAELIGGNITLQSDYGKGSTFTLAWTSKGE